MYLYICLSHSIKSIWRHFHSPSFRSSTRMTGRSSSRSKSCLAEDWGVLERHGVALEGTQVFPILLGLKADWSFHVSWKEQGRCLFGFGGASFWISVGSTGEKHWWTYMCSFYIYLHVALYSELRWRLATFSDPIDGAPNMQVTRVQQKRKPIQEAFVTSAKRDWKALIGKICFLPEDMKMNLFMYTHDFILLYNLYIYIYIKENVGL